MTAWADFNSVCRSPVPVLAMPHILRYRGKTKAGVCWECVHLPPVAFILNDKWQSNTMKWQIPPYLQLAFAPFSSKNLTICWCPALVQWNKAVQPWMSFISSSAPCCKRRDNISYCTCSAQAFSHCPFMLEHQEFKLNLTTKQNSQQTQSSLHEHLNHVLFTCF